ncbi:MAG TPA: purine-nucleoside phosphorylase [Firmicutes bacterium]|nr:purine-nucleoside phosphorylase [Bacillota bacterium]
MKPVHIVADYDDISELVLMPGDPLRAKYIAENFLEDAVLVNDVRNMLGYTGTYKGIKVSVIGSGMGIPSIGIYAYELAHFYGAKRIIRVGSAGALSKDVKVRDVVVATSSKSLSNFALSYDGDAEREKFASKNLIECIKNSIPEGVKVHFGRVVTSDAFDVYSGGGEEELKRLEFDDPLASEMEAFGLYKIGEVTGCEVACLLTITNSKFTPLEDLTSEEREKSLNDMITIALEAVIK